MQKKNFLCIHLFTIRLENGIYMKILTVSDSVEKSFLEEDLLTEKCRGIRFILGCGDHPPYYLEYLINSLNIPLFYVPGNHDEQSHQSQLMKKP